MQCTCRLTSNFIFPHCHFMTFNKESNSLTPLQSDLLVSVKIKENWPFYLKKCCPGNNAHIEAWKWHSPILYISTKTHQIIHNDRVWYLSLSLSNQSKKRSENLKSGKIREQEYTLNRICTAFFFLNNKYLSAMFPPKIIQSILFKSKHCAISLQLKWASALIPKWTCQMSTAPMHHHPFWAPLHTRLPKSVGDWCLLKQVACLLPVKIEQTFYKVIRKK